MLTQHIALVPEAGGVDLSELARVSAALQKQVTRDFAPLWGVSATVDAFHALEDVPVGYWPIILSPGELSREAGLYLDRNGQPYAQIGATEFWSFEASRACLELLVNPFGDRTTTGSSPRPDQGPAEFLVEVCAPCAARVHGYAINGVFVADFCTPAFYGASMAAGRRDPASFNGALRGPFQVLSGGYLTWHDSTSNSWWMRIQPGQTALDIQLGSAPHTQVSARSFAQDRGPDRGWGGGGSSHAFASNLKRLRDQTCEASQLRALRLRSLLGQRLQESLAPPSPLAFEHGEAALHDGALLVDGAEWIRDEEPITATPPRHSSAPPTLEGLRPQTAVPTLRGPAVPPPYTESGHAPAEANVVLPPPPLLPTRISQEEARQVGHTSSMPSRAMASVAPHPIERDRLWIGLSAIAAAAVLIAIVTRGISAKEPAGAGNAIVKGSDEPPAVGTLAGPGSEADVLPHAPNGPSTLSMGTRGTTAPSALKPARAPRPSDASAHVARGMEAGHPGHPTESASGRVLPTSAAPTGETRADSPAPSAEAAAGSTNVQASSLDDLIESRR